ncbi:MAG: transposase [Phycisphaeraceae bacterium]
MPRIARCQPGGMVFHVLNRGNARMQIFDKPADYDAFEKAMAQTAEHVEMRVLSYCLMPNHWHLLLRPRETGDLGRYMQRLTVTHVRRWHEHRHSTGGGHVYQGTYKSFPVQTDEHFLTVARYVERNACRANLVDKAQDWRWCSLWRRDHPELVQDVPALAKWPVPCPPHWKRLVNRPQNQKEVQALRAAVQRGRPFGSEHWQHQTANRLGLQSTFRPRGRPRKGEEQ